MVVKYRLDNGMVVLLEPIEAVVSVSVGLWVKAGSRNEEEAERGYAHFIEHMLFKGTSHYSAKDIARIVDRVGGQHNAATNREYTCYYINVISDYMELSINLLADMYYHSLFEETEIEKEKNVILEEIRMYEDAPDELIHDVFMECMLHNHPLGHPILGTAESINKTNKEKMVDFFNKYYSSENCIFVIAGNFKIETAKALIDQYLSRHNGKFNRALPGNRILPERILRKHISRDLEQVHFCMGVDGMKRDDQDRWALFTLSTILGGSMSSRLFQNIREREGLCYSIYSFHSSYMDRGVFGIYCGTSPENYRKALDLILRECEELVIKGIGEEELNDAKTFMKGNLALSLESTEVRMSQLAKNEMVYGRNFSFDETVEKINAITLGDFSRICRHIFLDRDLTLVSIGKLPEADEKIRSITLPS